MTDDDSGTTAPTAEPAEAPAASRPVSLRRALAFRRTRTQLLVGFAVLPARIRRRRPDRLEPRGGRPRADRRDRPRTDPRRRQPARGPAAERAARGRAAARPARVRHRLRPGRARGEQGPGRGAVDPGGHGPGAGPGRRRSGWSTRRTPSTPACCSTRSRSCATPGPRRCRSATSGSSCRPGSRTRRATSAGCSSSGVLVDAPYEIRAIGDPRTMSAALRIPGGVVDSLRTLDGDALIGERDLLDVTALQPPPSPQYARPAVP